MKKIKTKNNNFFDLKNIIFSFPIYAGICIKQNENNVVCQVSKQGKLKMQTKRDKPIIKHPKKKFIRGIEFILFSLIFYIKNLFFSSFYYDSKNNKKINNFQKNNNFLLKNILFLIFSILFFIFFNFFILNKLSELVGFSIFPSSQNILLKNLFIGIFKCLFFFTFIFLLRFIPTLNSLWQFNTAGNKAVINNSFRNLNFFNIFFEALLIDFFVVSLIGINVNWVLKLSFTTIVLLICFSISFELNLLKEKNKKFKWLKIITGILTYSPPNLTQMQVANSAICEGELMKKNIERTITSTLNESEIDIAFVLSEVRNTLKQNKIEDFGEAEWLIANTLKCNKLDIRLIKTISVKDYKLIQSALDRRLMGEPISKIFGYTEFYGLKIKVNQFVLSPRQETEILVERVLKELQNDTLEVLDIGTGSGAIAIAIAKNSQANVTAVDISSSALNIAKENAKILGAEIKFKQSDLFSKLKLKKFDIIISNPPYIKTDDIPNLEREVKNFDPLIALDGGQDGFYFYKKIIQEAPLHLKKNGKIFFEIGKGQAFKVKKLLTENFVNIKIVKDYNGIDRIIYGEKRN